MTTVNKSITKKVKNLTKFDADEQRAYNAILDELSETGRSVTLENLWSTDYDRKPVSILEFIENDYYIGDQVKKLAPVWKKELTEFFNPNSQKFILILTGSIGSGKCVTGNSIIQLDDGFHQIDDFDKGKGTNGFTLHRRRIANGRNGYSTTSHFYKERVTETIRVKTRNGLELSGTLNHPILIMTPSGTKVFRKLKKIKEGDYAVIPRGMNLFNQDPVKLDFIPSKETRRKPLKRYPKEMNQSLGSLLGYIIGSGSVMVNGRHLTFYVPFSKLEMGYDFSAIATLYAAKIIKHKKKYGYLFSISSAEFCEFIFYLAGKKSYAEFESNYREVPWCVLRANREIQIAFIRALFDTNGIFNKDVVTKPPRNYFRIQFSSSSRNLSYTVALMLLNFGIVPQFKRNPVKGGGYANLVNLSGNSIDQYLVTFGSILKRLSDVIGKREVHNRVPYIAKTIVDKINHIKDILDVCSNGVFWYKGEYRQFLRGLNFGVSSVKKYETYKWLHIVLNCIEEMGIFIPTILDLKYYIEKFIKQNYYYSPITSITHEHESAMVYDFTIPETHSFVSNGFISHNTTVASICQTYKLYELSCLKNPAEFYGLLPGTKIVFGIYSLTLDKADDSVDLMRQYVDTSPYFLKHMPRKPQKSNFIFPTKNIEVSVGSLENHALGDSILSFSIDEANFHKKAKSVDPNEKTRAHQLCNQARIRLASRFMRSGKVPGMIIMISSKKFQSSFIDEQIKAVKEKPEVAEITQVVSLPLWVTKRSEDFCGKWFDVLVGNEFYNSRVLEDDELIPDGCDVVSVPIEYYELFIVDADLALRDIAGVSTVGSSAYFPTKQRILDCMESRPHPFTKQEIYLPFGENLQISDYLLTNELTKVMESVRVPKIRPNVLRYLHIDIAYTEENVGITMAHPFLMPDNVYGVYVDFMLRIRPPVIGEIDLPALVDLIVYLRDIGFNLKKITFDQFQSRTLIQLLKQRGFESEVIPGHLAHYTHLKTCFNSGRINLYQYNPLLEEIETLERDPDGGRPHHGTMGTDDLLDSLTSVTSQCYHIADRTKKSKQTKIMALPNTDTIFMSIQGGNERYEASKF